MQDLEFLDQVKCMQKQKAFKMEVLCYMAFATAGDFEDYSSIAQCFHKTWNLFLIL